jgi:IS30 family transposase
MKSYQQLTQDLRYQIVAFLKAGFSQAGIARQRRVDPSTKHRITYSSTHRLLHFVVESALLIKELLVSL